MRATIRNLLRLTGLGRRQLSRATDYSAGLSDNGWMLRQTSDQDIDELMTWFPDAESVDIWGGPEFRFPFTRESFLEDCNWDLMRSFSLIDPDGRMAAFGQIYDRHGRGHLARLITHPSMRRQGAGRRLIRLLMRVASERLGFTQYSLFVYRHNEAAYRCYLDLGFSVQPYPEDAKMPDKCYFLTRSSD